MQVAPFKFWKSGSGYQRHPTRFKLESGAGSDRSVVDGEVISRGRLARLYRTVPVLAQERASGTIMNCSL